MIAIIKYTKEIVRPACNPMLEFLQQQKHILLLLFLIYNWVTKECYLLISISQLVHLSGTGRKGIRGTFSSVLIWMSKDSCCTFS